MCQGPRTTHSGHGQDSQDSAQSCLAAMSHTAQARKRNRHGQRGEIARKPGPAARVLSQRSRVGCTRSPSGECGTCDESTREDY